MAVVSIRLSMGLFASVWFRDVMLVMFSAEHGLGWAELVMGESRHVFLWP
jgi:hypothetical protein